MIAEIIIGVVLVIISSVIGYLADRQKKYEDNRTKELQELAQKVNLVQDQVIRFEERQANMQKELDKHDVTSSRIFEMLGHINEMLGQIKERLAKVEA